MTLRLIGAGLPRTGTNSLKLALEQLLGGPCYHMNEVFVRPQDAAIWEAATRGQIPDWDSFLDGYLAAVDWPPSVFWESLAKTSPDAPILLSVREDAGTWWSSVIRTIVPATLSADDGPWRRMALALFAAGTGTTDIENADKMIAAYGAHNARVRATVPASRLIEWRPEDGWEPLCRGLELPVPSEPFPHVNTRAEFAQRIGSEVPAPKR